MKTLEFDVMYQDRYKATLRYKYSPMFRITLEELTEFVEQRFPSLKGKDYYIAFNDTKKS